MSTLENLPILVVDDNKHACKLLLTILGAISHARVRTCNSPSEAYEMLQLWQPGMIITDFRMEPIDGLAFARELRSNGAHGFKLKPLLLMTGETPNRKLVEEVRAAGVDTMITKPIVPETLMARMTWSVDQARLRFKQSLQADSAPQGKKIWTVD